MGRSGGDKSADLRDANRGERIQRVLADAGVGSRRACEAMVESGEVTINGRIETELPLWVDLDEDRIVVRGRVIGAAERRIYVMLNKPARTLSSVKDEPGADRTTVSELVDHPSSDHLFPVGRLDYESVGLILLTNDGELSNRLTHPRYGVPKTYRVVVKGALDEAAARELERGIYLAQRKEGKTVGGARTARVELEVLHIDRDKTTMELTLREGRNRQVRRMLAAVGCPVRSLERVAMGPVRLKGLARGQWRELTRDEIRALRRAAASKPARSARSERSAPSREPMDADAGASGGTPKEGIRRRRMKNAINRGGRRDPGRGGAS